MTFDALGLPGRSRSRLNGWTVLAILGALPIALPVGVVFSHVFAPYGDIWTHLSETVLPRYVVNTLWLLGGVGIGVTLGGVGTAWLITMCRFPGRRFLEWALLLPLAMPAYVIAYTYTGLLDVAGPVQAWLRTTFHIGVRDYWFPPIRSLSGAIAILTLVLYPYVYLLARAAFLQQSVAALEVSRTLGRGPWRSFFSVALPLARPGIVAGVALALMEVLSDFGTVQFFAVDTFTTGIYRTWLALAAPGAAAQLSVVLMIFVVAVTALERTSRKGRRFHHTGGRYQALPGYRLNGVRAFCAAAFCATPIVLGFALPAVLLLGWAVENAPMAADVRFLKLVRNSVILAGMAAILTVALAIGVAYALRLRPRPVAAFCARFASSGYAVPGAVIAVGVMLPFGWFDNTLDRWARAHLGVSTGLILSGTIAALLFAYTARFFAAAFGAVEAGLVKITQSMDAASRTLGMGPGATLRRVHLPMLSSSVLTGAMIVFVDVMKELPATLIIRPFNFDTLAIRAFELANDEQLRLAALPALTIVAAGILPVIAISRSIAHGRPGHVA